jgi:hypothetical protein
MFRFTIRDVLLLTIVMALACGWWGDHRRAQAEISRQRIEGNGEMAWAAKSAGFLFWRHYDGLYLIPIKKTIHGQPRNWTAADWAEARANSTDPLPTPINP